MRGLLPACAASLRHEQDDQSNDKSCNASHRERHRERDQDKRLEALNYCEDLAAFFSHATTLQGEPDQDQEDAKPVWRSDHKFQARWTHKESLVSKRNNAHHRCNTCPQDA